MLDTLKERNDFKDNSGDLGRQLFVPSVDTTGGKSIKRNCLTGRILWLEKPFH